MKDKTIEIRKDIVSKWLLTTNEFIDSVAVHSGLTPSDTHKLAMEMAGTMIAQVHAIGTYGASMKSRKQDLNRFFDEIKIAYDEISKNVDERISTQENEQKEFRREIG